MVVSGCQSTQQFESDGGTTCESIKAVFWQRHQLEGVAIWNLQQEQQLKCSDPSAQIANIVGGGSPGDYTHVRCSRAGRLQQSNRSPCSDRGWCLLCLYRLMFHHCMLQPGKTLAVFIHDKTRLLAQAMPDLDLAAHDQLLLHQFMAGLPSTGGQQLWAVEEAKSL